MGKKIKGHIILFKDQMLVGFWDCQVKNKQTQDLLPGPRVLSRPSLILTWGHYNTSWRDMWTFLFSLQSLALWTTALDFVGWITHLQMLQGSRNWTPAATDPAGFREGDFMVATERMPPTAVPSTEQSPTGVGSENHCSLFYKDK